MDIFVAPFDGSSNIPLLFSPKISRLAVISSPPDKPAVVSRDMLGRDSFLHFCALLNSR